MIFVRIQYKVAATVQHVPDGTQLRDTTGAAAI